MFYVSTLVVGGEMFYYTERDSHDAEIVRERAWNREAVAGMGLDKDRITLYMKNGHKVGMQGINPRVTRALYLHMLDVQNPNPLS